MQRDRMTGSELESLWRSLSHPSTPGETVVCATGVSVGGVEVVIGLDHLGRPHVMVPLGDNRLVVSKRSAGVSANSPRPLLHEGIRRNYLDVCCTKPALRMFFARLAAELVSEAAKQEAAAASRCVALIDAWRALFGSLSGPFGRPQAVGLLGELFVLRELVRLSPRALQSWTGPLGGIHDFRNGTLALEVKTTLRREGRFHSISSIDQLEPPQNGRLDFISIRIEPVPGGPLSIAGLIRELETSGVDCGELSRRVEETGLRDSASQELEHETFELRDLAAYTVDDQFPRLNSAAFVAGSVPAGVIAVRYDIDLSTEPPFRMDRDVLGNCLKNFALSHAD